MFIVSSYSDNVKQYTLNTPWSLLSVTYNGSFSVSAQNTYPVGLWFKPDGTKMYVVNVTGMYQYSLSTPWSILSGVTYDVGFNIAGVNSISGMCFKPDGSSIFMSDFYSSQNKILEWIVHTPWDLFTVTFPLGPDKFKIIDSENNSGIFFKEDGSVLYTVRYDNGTTSSIHQFNM